MSSYIFYHWDFFYRKSTTQDLSFSWPVWPPLLCRTKNHYSDKFAWCWPLLTQLIFSFPLSIKSMSIFPPAHANLSKLRDVCLSMLCWLNGQVSSDVTHFIGRYLDYWHFGKLSCCHYHVQEKDLWTSCSLNMEVTSCSQTSVNILFFKTAFPRMFK
jgi:hypothetical protein